VTLLFAGHETTATTVMRLVMVLQSRPDVMEKLRTEQRQAVRQHGLGITGAALRDMPYLDAVVKETWRLHPIVPNVPRRAKRKFTLAGYDVPKGWGLALGLSEPLKDAPAWHGVTEGSPNDPRVFNPDRWRPVATSTSAATAANDGASGSGNFGGPDLAPGELSSPVGMLPPYMLTFGGGTRYCLGANLAWAELKAFLCVWARRYDFSCPLKQLHVKPFPALTITGGFPVQVIHTASLPVLSSLYSLLSTPFSHTCYVLTRSHFLNMHMPPILQC
ncbi:hypothetical protein Agub_g10267, partial [Astrephomene gubernaculifera]